MSRARTLTLTVSTLAVATLALTSCTAGSSGGATADPAGTDSITVALTGPPANLDFTTTAGAAIPQALLGNVYEGLVQVNQDGELEPLLAESWSLSDDRTVVTFTLRSGVTFSNGADFTAEDVKFSIDRVKSDAWTSGLKTKMDIVESVNVLSDTEVEVVLSRPSNVWLYDMATRVGAMFDESGVADLANQAIGTGPFTVESWKPNEAIDMAARSDYWGDAPKVSTATLKYFAEATATTNALQSGDVDVIYNMQAPALLSAFEGKPEFQVLNGESTGEIVLSMNNRVAPFDDVRVRQAVMHAIDRQAVMDAAWNGNGTLVGAPVPPSDPYYEDLNGVYPFDPAKAKELLKEAGAEGVSITFTVPTRPYATAISEIVVAQLKDVGIDAKIASAEFPAVWLDEVFTKHDYQMSIILAVEQRDVLTMFNNPDYYIGYDNSKIADAAAAADQADEAGYISGMKEVVRTIVDDAASNTLFLFPNTVVAKAEVTGIPANAVSEGLFLGDIGWN
ncbi:ABC transporter substrate-binding protein [Microbacterium esteraromaticum]|uniref:ABC transporter substrate-binding protein n=1 Tax=Microbacterium esteraromaticum TaxID=57043 RepID=UPI0019D34C6E|nr:ABC transporter substrate-binding protein [Microbacterium esteraromaticum]MBN7793267.1 ABC transporter substrate-binding protein [Microbacterium esteraromaticum]MBY6060416.1 ABC transporter substrate-binding protein [Microbacterium esteraromaticum]MCA1305617.1 ABC transporter substrate-binding protein [Microbacterium esteraromaticum]WDH79587.1 ABC transporter substrate-binding protein [Microbacterium esteraromaticum]